MSARKEDSRWANLAKAADTTWGLLSEPERKEVEAWSDRLDKQRAAAEKSGQVFPAPEMPPHIADSLAALPEMPPPPAPDDSDPFATPLDPDDPLEPPPPPVAATGPGQDPVQPQRPALIVVSLLERYAAAMARILPYLVCEYDSDVANRRAINPDYELALAACRQVAKWDEGRAENG